MKNKTQFTKNFKNITKYNNFLLLLDKKSTQMNHDYQKLILNINISGKLNNNAKEDDTGEIHNENEYNKVIEEKYDKEEQKVVKKKIIINTPINNINDLILVIENNPDSNADYNINMKLYVLEVHKY